MTQVSSLLENWVHKNMTFKELLDLDFPFLKFSIDKSILIERNNSEVNINGWLFVGNNESVPGLNI